MIFLSVQDVQAAKKKHQVSSELRPSLETWLHAVSGLSGSVTKLDQCGECLRYLGVPGGRSGKEQVTHAQESWLWASTPPCPAGHMGRCRGPCLYTRITSIPEPGRGGKQTAQPERRQAWASVLPRLRGVETTRRIRSQENLSQRRRRERGIDWFKCYLNPLLGNFWLVPWPLRALLSEQNAGRAGSESRCVLGGLPIQPLGPSDSPAADRVLRRCRVSTRQPKVRTHRIRGDKHKRNDVL